MRMVSFRGHPGLHIYRSYQKPSFRSVWMGEKLKRRNGFTPTNLLPQKRKKELTKSSSTPLLSWWAGRDSNSRLPPCEDGTQTQSFNHAYWGGPDPILTSLDPKKRVSSGWSIPRQAIHVNLWTCVYCGSPLSVYLVETVWPLKSYLSLLSPFFPYPSSWALKNSVHG